ncbi:MAG: hypothetical protein NTY70_19340 [Burkholderiales bacterium]|nr:hypothetical protein [Burkholderiales bacterium]
MKCIHAITISLFLLGGCAVSQEQQNADNKGPVCTREIRVGSNIPVVNCAASTTEQDRQRMVDDVNSSMSNMPRNLPSGK